MTDRMIADERSVISLDSAAENVSANTWRRDLRDDTSQDIQEHLSLLVRSVRVSFCIGISTTLIALAVDVLASRTIVLLQ